MYVINGRIVIFKIYLIVVDLQMGKYFVVKGIVEKVLKKCDYSGLLVFLR